MSQSAQTDQNLEQHLDDGSADRESSVVPDPETAAIKDLTAHCREQENFPEGWTKMKAKEKRREFRRLFCPQATETFDSNDPLHLLAEHVENLDREGAKAEVLRLREAVGMTYFELGGVLNLITKKAWYADWKFETFKDFVEAEMSMKYGKARYLVRVYTKAVELEIPWKKLEPIGWSKVALLLEVITQDTADYWLEKAAKMTWRELSEAVKVALKGSSEPDPESESGTKQFSLRLFEAQLEVIEAAMKEMGVKSGKDNRGVQLEWVCADWMSGQQGGLQALELKTIEDLKAAADVLFRRAKELGGTDFLALKPLVEALDVVFPDADIQVSAMNSPSED